MVAMRYCICTAAYPQADLRIRQYAEALLSLLAAREDAEALLVAESGMEMPAEFAGAERLHWLPSAAKTPSALRAAMLAAARDKNADWLVFIDFDDKIDVAAASMWDALPADAQIGYANMALIGSDGESLGRRMFRHMPPHVVAEDLISANCLGFSNTAIRRAALHLEDCAVPLGLTAVDWWLFSRLLGRGLIAVHVPGIAAEYRQYDGNLLGARSAEDVAALTRRIEALEAHYRASGRNDWLARLGQLRGLRDWPEALLRRQAQNEEGDWWFQSLTRAICDLTDVLEPAAENHA